MQRKNIWILGISMGIGCILMLYLFLAVYWYEPAEEGLASTKHYENAYLLQTQGKTVHFLYHGEIHSGELQGAELTECNTIADITMHEEKITAVVLKREQIKAKEYEIKDQKLALGTGTQSLSYELSEHMEVYDVNAKKSIVKERLAGYEQVTFVLYQGKVCAALAEGIRIPVIRVLLTSVQYGNVQPSAVITAEGACKVTRLSAEKTVLEESEEETGKMLSFKAGAYPAGTRLRLCTDGALCVESLSRGETAPKYPNVLELQFCEEGIALINELPLEDYLYGVLPGEMPATYQPEARKAQAVCARSYAYITLTAPRYPEYEANLDDTTNSQVYRTGEITEADREPVDATCGQILMDQDRVASTYYYSTSCGVGADLRDVWGEKETTYLADVLHSSLGDCSEVVQTIAGTKNGREALLRGISLDEEAVFRSFLQEGTVQLKWENVTVTEQVKTYEEDCAWYRWSVSIPKDMMTELVRERLALYQKLYPTLVKLEKEGQTELGAIQKITVVKRGKSGIVTELLIEGEQGSATLYRQTVIRNILSPEQLAVVRQDKKEAAGMKLLPSAFFYVEEETDAFCFYGGGYGHGVGMSQTGANEMAAAGMTMEELLAHYFPGTTLTQRYAQKTVQVP